MNICANFDILFYLSHPRNKYAEQTLFEINTMLYLAELLSIYDGCNAQKWGYGFARNKYGAPVSIERFYQYQNPAFWGGVPNISRWCLTHY